MLLEAIINRKGIRSDKIWANPLLFREPFRRIPFFLDTYALLKSQYWSRNELDALAESRLKETIQRASHLPFWKECFENAGINSNQFHSDEISRIPLLTRGDLFSRDIHEYTVEELVPKSRKISTSGSTGRPFVVYRDKQFELRASAVSERLFRTLDPTGKRPIIFVVRVAPIDFNFGKYHQFYIQGYTSVRHRILELQKFMNQFPHGVILFALGSALLEIARVCKELQIQLPIRGALFQGEELRATQLKEIEDILHTPVRSVYGATEMRQIGFECPEHRIHLNEESIYYEIVDDAGKPLPFGTKGQLVMTGFENQVMPLIRNKSGDIGVISDDPCPCGRTLRTIEFHGREIHLLNVGSGRTVSLIDISTLLDVHYEHIAQFQIVRTGECAFIVRMVPRLNFDTEKVERELMDGFKARIHPNVAITWELVPDIPEGSNGKAQYFIDAYTK